jgi:hypothetical protein
MRYILVLCFGILLTSAFSCKVEHLQVPGEPVKDISGTWSILGAARNGTDLTGGFDFTRFRITFTDSTYKIDSLLPFFVNATTGKWAFNDPKYPFTLILTPTDSSAAVSCPLVFPVVGGMRNMILTFSPGCTANSYQYTLQRVN